ncbi:zinc finger protein 507 [Genypterus blacodes]|uniref:zinc finger protein 507 n=1 Tax=Genypterus blacodes TaxID=154954 RepID=UPI003F75F61D
MEEISDVAVLITHSSTASSTSPAPPALGSHPQTHVQQSVEEGKQAADSLIQVIEKLSKIVEKRPQRRCTLTGQKRASQQVSSAGEEGERTEGARAVRGASPLKKIRKTLKEEDDFDILSSSVSGEDNNNNVATTTRVDVCGDPNSSDHKRTVTCYQCSLCRYIAPTLALLKEHLKQHNEQHSDLILMCSECRFTSRDQEQLEAHVRFHFDDGGNLKKSTALTELRPYEAKGDAGDEEDECHIGDKMSISASDGTRDLSQKKKWYSFEQYGLYRCLICSYVCSQQRMLKTHAWKHAGLVDCSYPIFEDEDGALGKREAQPAVGVSGNLGAAAREEIVVLSPLHQDKSLQKVPAGFKLQLCMPVAVENKKDMMSCPVANHNEITKAAEKEEQSVYPIKDLANEEPAVEVQVVTEAETEVEIDSRHGSASVTDSLLSSAQKIINSSPNSAGHINVIVERLPSAEDSIMVTNPLLLSPDMDGDKSSLDDKEDDGDHMDAAHLQLPTVSNKEMKEEMVSGWSEASSSDRQLLAADDHTGSDAPRDENIPPAARKRTHSESLRLHSLAAEALVAMPMRTPELPTPDTILSLKSVADPAQRSNPDERFLEVISSPGRTSEEAAAAVLELHSEGRDGLVEVDVDSPSTKAGISLSLLTVIERLRERSDQNASDEDILKELQDNAQFQNGAVASVVGGGGSAADSYMCSIPGMDGFVASPDGGLVDYISGSDRPYRCRLCRYSSGNKGYIKQHLRVHRQRQPYQCPICEHIATDSKDLECHMIHHCKTRTYQCKQCPDAFHYKSQLRNHEREHHSSSNDAAALTPLSETVTATEGAERVTDEECSMQKMYKCDVCDYTSSTYVGVRNHRRIHNSDKPYRCCSCDFATTNMNSLKSHMRRHPQERQAVQLLEQYRCSLCGYVCSHPPSLKSHMWKHAGDQNYNYEQVNKAINEAISQSSRAPQKLSALLESVAERPVVVQSPKDKAKATVDPLALSTSTTADALLVDRAEGLLTTHSESPSPQGKDPVQLQTQAQAQAQVQPRTGQLAAPGPGMEYCVLLFCCCICGFESTSKERLMEHMKDHEGDIISIILNKELQQQAEPPPGLQTAE